MMSLTTNTNKGSQEPLLLNHSPRPTTLMPKNGILNTQLLSNESSNSPNSYCLSVIPMDDKDFDLDYQRAKSISLFHVSAILCVISFNLLQNTFSWFSLSEQWNIPLPITYTLVVICAAATFIQNLVARALKIVQIPLYLTSGQKALFSTIEKKIVALNDEKKSLHRSPNEHLIFNDLIVLISPQEYEAMEIPFLKCFSSPGKTDFDFMLQQMAKRYKVRMHLLITTPEDYRNITLQDLPLQKDFSILAYSPEHYALKDNPDDLTTPLLMEAKNYNLHNHPDAQTTVYLPDHSWKRYLWNPAYRQHINTSGEFCTLLSVVLRDFLEFSILILGQIIVTTLQGVSSLAEILSKFGLNYDSNSARVGITFAGLIIGGNKAYVNNEIKADIALERAHKIYNNIACATHKTEENHTTTDIARNSHEISVWNIFSYDSTLSRHKRTLIAKYYLTPLFHRIIGWSAAAGTVFYYAGLAFLFGGPGLLFNLQTLKQLSGWHMLIPKEETYSNIYYSIFCLYNCISQASLSGLLNQGYDSVESSNKRAEKIQRKIYQLIQQPDSESTTQKHCTPKFLHNFFATNSYDANFRIIYTLLDSLSASVTAIVGSNKMVAMITHFFPSLSKVIAPLPFIIGLMFFYTQTQYSFVLYGRDGKVWEYIADLYTPSVIKNTVAWVKETIFNLETNHHCRYPNNSCNSPLSNNPFTYYYRNEIATSPNSNSDNMSISGTISSEDKTSSSFTGSPRARLVHA